MDGAVDPSRWDDLPRRVEHNTHRMLDLLSEHRVQATFFVLGWVAERLPQLVVEIARRGHEVACHGYAHRLVYRLGPQRFRDDVSRGKRILEAGSGGLPDAYELPRHLLDLSLQLPVTGTLALKLDGKNLLDSPYRLTQGSVLRSRYLSGRVFGFSASWRR